MREIVLDTETTGLDPLTGDRVIEIGCIELVNHLPTGRNFHKYLNPERDVPADAVKVHGLTTDFLRDKPLFLDIADEFLDFLADAPLVIHNAAFDMKFLNAELTRIKRPALPATRAVDTLILARQRYPGAQASLDALCRRFGIDNSSRTFHGALLDCELLADVYLELRGGRQPDLVLATEPGPGNETTPGPVAGAPKRTPRPARPHAPTPEELTAHAALVEKLGDQAIWRQ